MTRFPPTVRRSAVAILDRSNTREVRLLAALRGSLLLCLAVLLLPACRSIPESVNRQVYAFNKTVDEVVLTPVVGLYLFITPPPLQEGISNFLNNLRYGDTVANQLLQGKPMLAYKDLQRWTTNTVLGVGGIFDPATGMGMEKHEEDFGQTLAIWGVPEGEYFVIPILGPATPRDAVGRVVAFFTSPGLYVDVGPIGTPVTILSFVNQRLEAEQGLRQVREEATDEYAFVREAYLQKRRFDICDGNIKPQDDVLDEDFDDLDDLDGEGLDGAGPGDDGGLPGLDDLDTPGRGAGPDDLPGLDDLDGPGGPVTPGDLPGLDDLDAAPPAADDLPGLDDLSGNRSDAGRPPARRRPGAPVRRPPPAGPWPGPPMPVGPPPWELGPPVPGVAWPGVQPARGVRHRGITR